MNRHSDYIHPRASRMRDGRLFIFRTNFMRDKNRRATEPDYERLVKKRPDVFWIVDDAVDCLGRPVPSLQAFYIREDYRLVRPQDHEWTGEGEEYVAAGCWLRASSPAERDFAGGRYG